MKLDSRFAGTLLKEYHTIIPWRATTNYAASVADDNPLYFDDKNHPSLVAPPTFPVAVTWPILSHLQDFITARDFPGVFSGPRSTILNTWCFTDWSGRKTN